MLPPALSLAARIDLRGGGCTQTSSRPSAMRLRGCLATTLTPKAVKFLAFDGKYPRINNMQHAYTIAAYKIQDSGFRGVILNRETKERIASEVLPTLSAATFWAKKSAFEKLGETPFTLAPLRIRGEYRANVWVA